MAKPSVSSSVRQLGIGELVEPEDARPGDFLQLWQTNKSGHIVVFLGWVKRGSRPIGVHYRSSQTLTNGVGNRVEYFAEVAGKNVRLWTPAGCTSAG